MSCQGCDSVFAWCGEQDHAVGVYDGRNLCDLGLGPSREWAREGCPKCGGGEMGYTDRVGVERLGFAVDELLFSGASEG